MNDLKAIEQEVQALRLAAERGNWNSCRDAVEALLVRFPPRDAVRLTRDFVARRLPVFERQQPGVNWPRELLEVVGDKSSTSRRWPEEDEFPGPGGNSFTKAVESLWSASLRIEDARECIAELMSALSRAILAESTEYWGSRHPEEWALWYRLAMEGNADPRTGRILMAMARDPDVKRLERAAWMEAADQLEAALRGRAGTSAG
jgi:hypothetical protein